MPCIGAWNVKQTTSVYDFRVNKSFLMVKIKYMSKMIKNYFCQAGVYF